MSGIADRVGALDGILTIEPTWMGAQIPGSCANFVMGHGG
jgi:hypothetical protein